MTRSPLHNLARPVIPAPPVAIRIVDFLVRTEVERLALFRQHLDATMTAVSPLLLELARLEGIGLGDATASMRPPEDWPWRPLTDHAPAQLRRAQRQAVRPGAAGQAESRRFARMFADPGVIVRGVDHPRGRFAIRPCERVLGFTAAVGPCLLSAYGASALLKLPERLPETLMMALPGRPAGQVFDHPLFADREYRIVRVLPDLGDGTPVLTIRAPLVPFSMSSAADTEAERC